MIELVGQFSFGTRGTARPFLGEGWSILEGDFSWTENRESRISVPVPEGSGTLMLEIGLSPLVVPPILRRQRLIVWVNGLNIADVTVGTDGPLGFDIPDRALAGRSTLDLVLQCPDAVAPSEFGSSGDTRVLGFAVRGMMLFRVTTRPEFAPRTRGPLPRVAGGLAAAVTGLTGLSVPDLAGFFESLGHNCEFGLAQRSMGTETLGLLRFGGISLEKLAEGLDLEFDGIDAPGNLATYINEPGSEFMVRDRAFGTSFHSGMHTETSTADAVLTVFYRSLGFLRRKLAEDLRLGGKIFVLQHPEARSVAHIRPFLTLLRSHGPNTLLFVTEGADEAAGSVTQIEPDLLHGTVAHLAPVYDVPRVDVAPWVEVCANAYRLWRETASLRQAVTAT